LRGTLVVRKVVKIEVHENVEDAAKGEKFPGNKYGYR